MKKLTTILFLLCSYLMMAQPDMASREFWEQKKDSAYEATYQKLKQLHIEKIHSPEHLKTNQLLSAYKKKWRSKYTGSPEDFAKDYSGLKWLKDNWQITEFKSYEEAEAEFAVIFQAVTDEQNAHQEYMKYYTETVLKYGPYIYTDMYMEVIFEYPDKW